MRSIDHIVYAVPDLHEAVEDFRKLSGVLPVIGGRHLDRGTHNALVNIGNGAYLELIAADTDNRDFTGDRWMGVDLIDSPTIVRWSIKSEHINQDAVWLEKRNPLLSSVVEGSRQTEEGNRLAWKMTLPSPYPMVEGIPFFTDWSESSFHPCDRLPEESTLLSISISGPDVSALEVYVDDLNVPLILQESQDTCINIEIKTPTGRIIL